MRILIDLYKSADIYGKGSLDRAMDLAKLLSQSYRDCSYDSGGWNEPFTIFLPNTLSIKDSELIKELVKDAGLIICGAEV